jgi:hypothetical protein
MQQPTWHRQKCKLLTASWTCNNEALITDTIQWMEMGVWLKRSVLCTIIGLLKSGIRGGTDNKGFHSQLHSPTEITRRRDVVGSDYWLKWEENKRETSMSQVQIRWCCACMFFHDNYKPLLQILTFNIIIIHLSLGFSSFVALCNLLVV